MAEPETKARPPARPEDCDIMVTNGFVVTMDRDRRIFAAGSIAITGRRIAAVGPDGEVRQAYRPKQVFDARGAVVHPGFVDPHLHIVHGTCRGVFTNRQLSGAQPASFPDWKADVTSEDEHVAAQLAGLEMLRRGFTCFVEPGTVFDGDAVASAAETVGVRGLLSGPYLWDQVEIMEHMGGLRSQSLFDRVPPRLDRCLDQLPRELHRNRDPDSLVRGFVSVYGLGTASDDLLKAAKACADSHGVAFHQHEGYVAAATRADEERLGRSRIVHLAELGVLGENATLVHMNVMTERDMAPIEQSGTSIVWCPIGTLQLAAGNGMQCRLPGLFKRGVEIALGVDGALDATVGAAGPLAFHLAAGLGEPITPENVLEMQTIYAANVAGLGYEIGSLEPGKKADLVIRTDAIECCPATNPVQQLALTAGAGSVDTVIVDGRVVVRSGLSTRVDERAVAAEAKASVLRRLSRLGLSPGIGWPVIGSDRP